MFAERPLSQAELARRVGVAQSTISRYERGERTLSDERLARISEITSRAIRLREQIDPVKSIMLDSTIAAADPQLMIRELKILLDGAEAIIEELHTCVDLREFDVLEKLLHLARERMSEIKAALAPLLQRPS
jgi:transcriptional regulator with XRE-family HTH domain